MFTDFQIFRFISGKTQVKKEEREKYFSFFEERVDYFADLFLGSDNSSRRVDINASGEPTQSAFLRWGENLCMFSNIKNILEMYHNFSRIFKKNNDYSLFSKVIYYITQQGFLGEMNYRVFLNCDKKYDQDRKMFENFVFYQEQETRIEINPNYRINNLIAFFLFNSSFENLTDMDIDYIFLSNLQPSQLQNEMRKKYGVLGINYHRTLYWCYPYCRTLRRQNFLKLILSFDFEKKSEIVKLILKRKKMKNFLKENYQKRTTSILRLLSRRKYSFFILRTFIIQKF